MSFKNTATYITLSFKKIYAYQYLYASVCVIDVNVHLFCLNVYWFVYSLL